VPIQFLPSPWSFEKPCLARCFFPKTSHITIKGKPFEILCPKCRWFAPPRRPHIKTIVLFQKIVDFPDGKSSYKHLLFINDGPLAIWATLKLLFFRGDRSCPHPAFLNFSYICPSLIRPKILAALATEFRITLHWHFQMIRSHTENSFTLE